MDEMKNKEDLYVNDGDYGIGEANGNHERSQEDKDL